MENEIIVSFEFYNGEGVSVYWAQSSFTLEISDKDSKSEAVFDMLIEWANANYGDKGTPRITNIWTISL